MINCEPGWYWVVFYNNTEEEPAWWTGEAWLRAGEAARIGGDYAAIVARCVRGTNDRPKTAAEFMALPISSPFSRPMAKAKVRLKVRGEPVATEDADGRLWQWAEDEHGRYRYLVRWPE